MSDPNSKNIPLGLFYGDSGAPGGLPTTDAWKSCPFLDQQANSFCTLDGDLCPYVGFVYHKCKKYIYNISRGQLPRSLEVLTKQLTPKQEHVLDEIAQDLEYLEEARKASTIKPDGQTKKKETHPDEPLVLDILRSLKTHRDAHEPIVLTRDEINKLRSSYGAQRDIDYNLLQDEGKVISLLTAYAKHDLKMSGVSRQKLFSFVRSISGRADGLGELRPGRPASDATADTKKGPGPPPGETQPTLAFGDTPPATTPSAPGAGEGVAAPPVVDPTQPAGGTPRPDTTRTVPAPGGRGRGRGRVGAFIRGKLRGEAPRSSEASTKNPYGVPSELVYSADTFKAHFQNLLSSVPPDVRTKMERRIQSEFGSLEGLYGFIRNLEDNGRDLKVTKDKIAADYNYFANAAHDMASAITARDRLLQNWQADLDVARQQHTITDQHIRILRGEKATSKVAQVMDKIVDGISRYEVRKNANGLVDSIVIKAALPLLKREDLEIMRMSEQAGLRAIQLQHRYGKDYGKFKMKVLFVKQIILPILSYAIGGKMLGDQLLPIVLRLFPDAFLDSFYFATRDEVPKLSRDDKTRISQRMSTQGGYNQVMGRGLGGWENTAGLPPDTAVLHTRWLPTTKKKWAKSRNEIQNLTYHRARQLGGEGSETWRQSWMPKD
jgi:hypothetical protein